MYQTERIYRQVALWIAVWFLVIGAVLAGIGYWQMTGMEEGLYTYQEHLQNTRSAGEPALFLKDAFLRAGLASVVALVISGLLLWLILRAAIRKEITHHLDEAASPAVKEKEDRDREAQARYEERRGLHLLALLQREGRLVDFLQEDLRAYDDAQIGAAVRGIQESCRQSLDKYVGPRPVIDKEEGGEITIDEGFDANRIRLTGNVSGRPPFKGILQHRGWQSSGLNLPTLSDSQDPAIIAPAEVEIQ